MKTTGMVRRVDTLGRIVIPKEIRKVLKIKENEQVEINVQEEEIVISKYSEFKKIDEAINNLIKAINNLFHKDIIITDLNNIVLSTNNSYLDKEISPFLSSILDNRDGKIERSITELLINKGTKELSVAYIIKPILVNGDVLGVIGYLSKDHLNEFDYDLFKLINSFLDKYLE